MKVIKNVIICNRPDDEFGFFGWPSIARQADGTLIAASSGLRSEHVCPWGKTVIFKSLDNGNSWSGPMVVNNTPLDDRDAGIISLGGQRLALTWFTSNTFDYKKQYKDPQTGLWQENFRKTGAVLDMWDDELVNKYFGSWVRVSPDGEYWGEMRRVPVNSPHGFTVLKDGSWLYFGKLWPQANGLATHLTHDLPVTAALSTDEGRNWEILGSVPDTSVEEDMACEAHVTELADGTLLGAIRIDKPYRTVFSRSVDGGRSWSAMEETPIKSAPPHLMCHSSGAVICSYGYRFEPYGQRVSVSFDGGKNFDNELILRSDAQDGDLGYAATAEMADGKLFTVYYQPVKMGNPAALQGTIWEL